ncbi:MAG: SAM-dependent methyltransferase [Anaerolineae bacterium]|jgi:methyltransferase (TIGR00027 family)|nr:SAM-dependent methyltransferase [Anaerolineae bacterium]MBT7069368.1 SAM-dependent methyltransferase [Anaerolineae bacterium]MBT7326017.1 SAM-dependent methyltransferase [Anaerolineae bacterium]MBT7602389.1 SAM-dependent methyltransferase [Anaerolineae bacterium]
MTDKNTEKQRSGILRFTIKLFQIILYIPIQIIFIPFAIIGLIVGMYKEMVNSKKLGVSFSAGQALQYRWFMHYLETRPDTFSVAFTKKFPCESHFALWTIMGAFIISQRLFGFKTRLSEVAEPEEANLAAISGSRVVTFDRIMEKYAAEMEQIVLPGAGFDLIALHFTKGKQVRVFELDQANTLNLKIETMKKAGIEHDWITYIPVDYANESWVDQLFEAGFDKTKKTLFLWQSVSLYLDAGIVRETLKDMADLCVEGSVIAQDFYSEAYSSGEYSFIANRNMSLIESMGEPAKFGVDMSDDPKAAVESFLAACGLQMTEYIQFGEKLDIEPFYCIVEAEKR